VAKTAKLEDGFDFNPSPFPRNAGDEIIKEHYSLQGLVEK
jgi:hypothetical protein